MTWKRYFTWPVQSRAFFNFSYTSALFSNISTCPPVWCVCLEILKILINHRDTPSANCNLTKDNVIAIGLWKVPGTLFRPTDIGMNLNSPWWDANAVSSRFQSETFTWRYILIACRIETIVASPRELTHSTMQGMWYEFQMLIISNLQ